MKNGDLSWAWVVLAVNVILFASHAWALSRGLSSESSYGEISEAGARSRALCLASGAENCLIVSSVQESQVISQSSLQ